MHRAAAAPADWHWWLRDRAGGWKTYRRQLDRVGADHFRKVNGEVVSCQKGHIRLLVRRARRANCWPGRAPLAL